MNEDNSRDNLFSWQELTTQAGAVAAVVTITNAVHYAFGWNPRYFGLLLSVACATFGVTVSGDTSWQIWVTVLPNSFLIYAGSVGTTSMMAAAYSPDRTLDSSNIPVSADAASIQPENGEFVEEIPRQLFWSEWF